MGYKKRILRKMSPTARKVARLTGELESITRRLKNLIGDIEELEFDSRALKTAKGIAPSDPAERTEE